MTKHTQREAWLNAMAREFAPAFKAAGHALPKKYRISCGFTVSKNAIGECHYSQGSMDGAVEIFIHPGQDGPERVADILIHELCHAALGAGYGHGPVFRKLATALGLAGPMKSTVAGPKATVLIKAAIKAVGPYPHAALLSGEAEDVPRPQSSRAHVNVRCPACDFHAKVLKEQMDMGRLRCPHNPRHGMLLTAEERILLACEAA